RSHSNPLTVVWASIVTMLLPLFRNMSAIRITAPRFVETLGTSCNDRIG
ncbi:MAG: hypothetical protein K0Q46_2236, partial [Rhodococcus erythropolis]|nr:hypothetical protein [Rhodococcus erythropolis]